MNRSRTLAAAAGLAVLATVLLAGCSSSPSSESAGQVMAEGAPAAAPAAAMVDKAVPGPQVITTAWVTLAVEQVPEAVEQVITQVTAAQGSISQQDLSSDGGSTAATLTVRVPADRLDAFLSGIAGLGTVEQESRQAADVTQQTVDLDARLGALDASLARLHELQAQAANVADLVAVETELANRQAERDSLAAQRRYLADQVSMSAVTISIHPLASPEWQAPGFLIGIQNGWNAFIGFIAIAITALGFLLPFIAVAAVIVIPVLWVVVRRSRRK